MQRNHFRHESGLSLVEVLVTIVIIAILLVLLIPALGRSQDKARNAKCQSNLRQLYLIITAYADDYEGSVPHSSHHITNHPALLACPSDAEFGQDTNPPWAEPSSYNFNNSWKLRELPPNGWLATEQLPWHDPKAVMPAYVRPSGYHNQLTADGRVVPTFLGIESQR